MTKYKKYKIKTFTLPAGKYIINNDDSITVQDLVIEMKSVTKKKRKQNNNSKPPKWFKDFVDNEFKPFRKDFDNVG